MGRPSRARGQKRAANPRRWPGLRALPAGAPFLHVFRFAGTAALLGYTMALWQMSIWYRRAWSLTLKATVDGLIYALLTAATFGWLWPR